MPPTKSLDSWVVRKGIAPRGKGGKFAKREGIKFAIAKAIKKRGIRPSLFFTKQLFLHGNFVIQKFH